MLPRLDSRLSIFEGLVECSQADFLKFLVLDLQVLQGVLSLGLVLLGLEPEENHLLLHLLLEPL